ncbi:RHS repeat domain-containing protein [Kaistella palustris]|uniref:RHS repeat domain-containing protein n=1 Tax=Kaistella palustris TaxID=493376 RepID=UPI0003FA4E94|nr:RHS repeat domain-containing protein [Kaistella palustris]
MRKIITAFLLVILSTSELFAQGIPPAPITKTIDMFPKTPDVAALTKHIDIPPGNFTGVANFTIPIYTINIDGVKIPIELLYTTTGIKVGEIASRVGLGWALSTGPSLTRQVIGSLDNTTEKPVFQNINQIPFMCAYDYNTGSYSFNSPCGIALSALGYYPYLQPINPDSNPDIFSYNLVDSSGRFILDYNGIAGIPMPYNLTKITPLLYYGKINGMKMVDEKGVVYKFKDDIVTNALRNTSTCNLFNEEDAVPNMKLDTITTLSNRKIIYNYNKPIVTNYITSISENKIIDTNRSSIGGFSAEYYPAQRCINKTASTEHVLSDIIFDGGKILFYYNNDAEGYTENIRQDLIGEVYLTRIKVMSESNKIIKDFTLNYSYFDSSNDFAPELYANILSNSPEIFKRLKLIEVKDNLNAAQYTLEYYEEDNLPNRMSFAQDYWGVYNGKHENQSPLPTIKTHDLHSNKIKVFLGADKNPDITFGVIGNLEKITYPTGGFSKITYEADDYIKKIYVDPVYKYTKDSIRAIEGEGAVAFEIPTDTTFNKRITLFSPGKDEIPPRPHTRSSCGWNLWKKINGQYINIEQNHFTDEDRVDEPGFYKLEIQVNTGAKQPPEKCEVQYDWITEQVINNSETVKTGTIRIKQIESESEDNGKIVRKYFYVNPSTNQSSGINRGEELFASVSYSEVNVGPSLPAMYGVGRTLKVLSISNNPGWQINTVNGKAIGYEYVQEIYQSYLDPTKNYKKSFKFNIAETSVIYQYEPFSPVNISWPQKNLDDGLLLEEKFFNNVEDTIRLVKNEYEYDSYFNQFASMNPYPTAYNSLIAKGMDIRIKRIDTDYLGGQIIHFNRRDFDIRNMWIKNVKSTTTDYVNNQPTISTEQTTAYSTNTGQNRHTFPESQTSTVIGSGDISTSNFKYPSDLASTDTVVAQMVSANIISDPLEKEIIKNGNVVSKIKTIFAKNTETNNLILPVAVFSKDLNSSTMESQFTYDLYDTNGNLLQYTTKSGVSTVIIWGYNQTQPIAKVEGATYPGQVPLKTTDIAQYLIDAIVNASNLDDADPSEESNFIIALDNFRKNEILKDYQITTYTYDPLIGVTSITPPSGIREIYKYDTANRLQSVIDVDGNILKEYQYHYKP